MSTLQPQLPPPRLALDLMLILEVTANIASIIGLCLNVILLYLILCRTSKMIADYKLILLQNCIIDVVFTLVNDAAKMQTEYKNGQGYLLMIGSFSRLPFPFNHFLMSTWIFSIILCVASVPVQFIYRYYMIVLDQKLTLLKYFMFLAISTLVSISYGAFYCYIFWPNEASKAVYGYQLRLLKDDPYYFREIPQFFALDIFHWPLRVLFSYASVLVTVGYGIIIYTCIKVWKKLNEYGSISFQAQRIHKQMTTTIILQAIIPLIFLMAPITIMLIATTARVNIPGLGFIVSLYICWIPVANPLVTIFSIKPYRQSIFLLLLKIYHKVGGSSISTSINSISGGVYQSNNGSGNQQRVRPIA